MCSYNLSTKMLYGFRTQRSFFLLFLWVMAVDGRKNINFFHYREKSAIFSRERFHFHWRCCNICGCCCRMWMSRLQLHMTWWEKKSRTRVNKIIKLKINFIYINHVIIQHTQHELVCLFFFFSLLANQLCSFKMQIFSSFSLTHKREIFSSF